MAGPSHRKYIPEESGDGIVSILPDEEDQKWHSEAGMGRVLQRNGLLKLSAFGILSLFVFLTILGSSSFGFEQQMNPDLPRSALLLRQKVLSDLSAGGIFGLGTVRPKELPACPKDSEDYVPCYNTSTSLQDAPGYGDRDCRLFSKPSRCLIPPPKEYRVPLKWPDCLESIWSRNVKISSSQTLSTGTRTKRLMLVEDKLITFQSEHSGSPDGIESYSQRIAKMIGLESDTLFHQAGVQTVLDIGCGFGSLGAHLFSRKVMTLCVAQYEAQGSQVQFALERGLPAMIGTLITKQLPYPAFSFDMVHCSECGVDWSAKGTLLMEVDRLLRPGGYFVWTSTGVADPDESLLSVNDQKKWKNVEDLAKQMCWDMVSRQEKTVIWKKNNEPSCYLKRGSSTLPSLCNMDEYIESSWYQPLHSCIVGAPKAKWISAWQQNLWPNVLSLPSFSAMIQGYLAEELTEDSDIWLSRIRNYWTMLSPLIFSDHPKRPAEDDPLPPPNMVRNVMDMNAAYGSFNTALLQSYGKLVWVMNVIPTNALNTLPAIFSRGLIGTLHDWCEAFPTYPRTYDLLHGFGLLSQEMDRPNGCGLAKLLLEMDRILRPEGWVILRDKVEVIEDARLAAHQLRWEARVVEVEEDSELRLLVCQKTSWKS